MEDGTLTEDGLADRLLEHVPGCCWDDDAASESIIIAYVTHLEAEVKRLGGTVHRDWCAE